MYGVRGTQNWFCAEASCCHNGGPVAMHFSLNDENILDTDFLTKVMKFEKYVYQAENASKNCLLLNQIQSLVSRGKISNNVTCLEVE